MNIDICTIDWVTISAFITAIMALIAGITLRQNHLQLKELKRQWEATNRARLNFSIIFNRGSFLLKISSDSRHTDNTNINKNGYTLLRNHITINSHTGILYIKRYNICIQNRFFLF